MGNKSITEKSSKEIATEIFYGPAIDAERKISHIDDPAVLNELTDMAFQKNRKDITDLTNARLVAIQT